jgi:hypothetical protein
MFSPFSHEDSISRPAPLSIKRGQFTHSPDFPGFFRRIQKIFAAGIVDQSDRHDPEADESTIIVARPGKIYRGKIGVV